MNKVVYLILLWFACLPCVGQESIRPLVATSFGKPVVVTAEFVETPNDYYAQNMVTEPFYLKVLSVVRSKN
jgi:hypothetical protein